MFSEGNLTKYNRIVIEQNTLCILFMASLVSVRNATMRLKVTFFLSQDPKDPSISLLGIYNISIDVCTTLDWVCCYGIFNPKEIFSYFILYQLIQITSLFSQLSMTTTADPKNDFHQLIFQPHIPGLGSAERHSSRASYGSRDSDRDTVQAMQKPTIRVKDVIKVRST